MTVTEKEWFDHPRSEVARQKAKAGRSPIAELKERQHEERGALGDKQRREGAELRRKHRADYTLSDGHRRTFDQAQATLHGRQKREREELATRHAREERDLRKETEAH
jgi:hypothetical protein